MTNIRPSYKRIIYLFESLESRGCPYSKKLLKGYCYTDRYDDMFRFIKWNKTLHVQNTVFWKWAFDVVKRLMYLVALRKSS